jgi:molybdate transport system ATP-binding protein
VSHALADAWEMNADAIVLNAGKIEAHGPACEVLATYRDRLLDQLGAGAVSDFRFRT